MRTFLPSRRPGQRGFTLVEIMISITILMIVMASIYSVWFSILRGAQAGNKAALNAQRGRVAMRAIEDALSTSQMFVLNARHYYFLSDTTSDPDIATLSVVSRLPGHFPGSAIYPDLVVRRVMFTVEPGASKADLVMRQVPVMMAESEVGQEYAISLVQNVKFFRMEFYDQQMNEWVPEWMNTNQIPKLVRVALAYGGPEDRNDQPAQILSRVINVPSSAILPQYQLPGAPGGGGPVPGLPGGGNTPPPLTRPGENQRPENFPNYTPPGMNRVPRIRAPGN